MQPCRCCGSVRYAHQTCLRTWIAGSGISSCELCNYKFRTKKKCIKNFHKVITDSLLKYFLFFAQ